jgi:hypothetical protein
MEIIWVPLTEKAIDDIFGFYAEKNVYVAHRSRGFAIRAWNSKKRTPWHGLQTRASEDGGLQPPNRV